MKLIYILVIFSSLLTSCEYFKNREIKNAATEIIKEDAGLAVNRIQETLIGDKNTRGKDFVKYIQNHTEVEITGVRQVTDSVYLVDAKVRSLSPRLQQMLIEMVAKLDMRTANAFNFSNAIEIIKEQKPDLTIEVEHLVSIEVQDHNGTWGR